uniref:Suppressor APC domain-containing protein n=1 Tax=Homalodisca liturata TaxID=320908 RepID=A0A1B6HNP1_9HEMI
MPPPSQSATLDGLPKPFVGALRTLFDIMDDKGAGFVKFSEIERRWQDDGTKGLPKGVIESLRKVTPPNGLLSFERFCAGLKICLLRNQVESRQPSRPPSAPLLDMDKPQWNSCNTATVRPNNAMAQQRTLSMPQLPGDQKDTVGIPVVKSPPLYGPPKPPRTAAGLERAMQLAASERERAGGLDKQEIRTALQNWQLGVMMGDQEEKRMAYSRGRSIGDGKPAVVAEPQPVLPHKKGSSRRREPRRHTLQNGIDYNMLKRMKQIEQEKDVLMQGLQAVEKARDWYLKQVAAVQEKMKYLGRMGSHMDQWSEAQHERLELQRARVLEVNRHLAALTESGERGGLPLHMNLAVTHPLTRLKQQNLLLTEEVGKKSERISVLEREKAALLRELFQNRGQLRRSDVNPDPVGFM